MAQVSHSLAKRHCLINASYSEMQALLQFFMQIYRIKIFIPSLTYDTLWFLIQYPISNATFK